MAACVVWMDSHQADVFHIKPEGVQKKHMKLSHHPKAGGHQEGHDKKEEETFFQDLAKEIGVVEELLIFGAGMAKNHFKSHLERHNQKDLLNKIVGVESLDHLTENQILEASRKYFKKVHVFKN